jgi:anhydro-N-acetylmuramic acid kinase
MLGDALAVRVEPIEAIDADGDALEAQAFAFLAVRSRRGLPISFPGTTGVPEPLPGGRLARASREGPTPAGRDR